MKKLEILWGILALLFYKLALWPIILIINNLPFDKNAWVISFIIPPACCMFIFNLLIIMAVLHRLVPLPKCGHYQLKREGEVFKWMYHTGVQNLSRILGMSRIIFAYPLLRRVYFFASRAKVHPSAIISYEVKMIDPFLLQIDKGAKIGEWTKFTCHHSDNKNFFIGKIIIGKDALIGGNSTVGPNVLVKEGGIIGASSMVIPNTIVNENETWFGSPAKKANSK